MIPYYQDDSVTLYHGDCRDLLPLPGDVLVTDPPYGMDWNTRTARFSGGSPASSKRRGAGRSDWLQVAGDDEPFDPAPLLALGIPSILWGANHFAARLPVGTTLVWLKRFDGGFGSFLSDAEIAWQRGGHGVYCHRDTSLAGTARQRTHPTEKPVGLMRWCIDRLPPGTVLDPYAGSGATLRAAKDLGRKAIGIEIEERYCEIAAKRCSQEVLALA